MYIRSSLFILPVTTEAQCNFLLSVLGYITALDFCPWTKKGMRKYAMKEGKYVVLAMFIFLACTVAMSNIFIKFG